jgi:methyl-accepting chemotaxis protein
MARVKGRDVIIELMDTVEKLQETTTQHADLLESMAEHAARTSAQLTALAAHTAYTARRTNELSQRTNELSQRTNELSQRMNDLAQRTNEFAQRMNDHSSRIDDHSLGMRQLSERTAALETEFQKHAENALLSADLGRKTQSHVGHLARLLKELADETDSRLEEIEHRVTKLERKTG